jgi:hypothetical protein
MTLKIDGNIVEQGTDVIGLVTGLLGDDFEMFNNAAMSAFELIAKIKLQKELEDRKAFESNINVQVQRLAPNYSPSKAKILDELITSVSITTDSLNWTDSPHGSTVSSHFEGVDKGEVQVTWWDLTRNDIIDFLTMISPRNQLGINDLPFVNKTIKAAETIAKMVKNYSNLSVPILADSEEETKPILPTDGTYLLPKEYYFSIKIQNVELDRFSGVKSRTIILDGEYRLTGALDMSRDVGSEEWAKVTATFKPL